VANMQYVLSLLVKAEDQTQAAFAAIGKGGENVAAKTQAAFDSLNKTLSALRQNLHEVHAAAAATGQKPNTQAQIDAFQQLKTMSGGLQTELSKLPLGLGTIATGAVGAIGGVMSLKYAFDSLTQTISEGLVKYSEAAILTNQLATVWKATGREMPIASLRTYTQAISDNTTYSERAVAEAAKMMAIFPGITDELMPKALKASADIAAFKDVGIEQAATMLGRASRGDFTALQRMGIHLSANTKNTKDFGAALGEISTALGGQAAARLNTYTGQQDKLAEASVRVKKELARLIEPASTAATEGMSAALNRLAKTIKETVDDGTLDAFYGKIKNISKGLQESGKEADSAFDRIGAALKAGVKELTGGGGPAIPGSVTGALGNSLINALPGGSLLTTLKNTLALAKPLATQLESVGQKAIEAEAATKQAETAISGDKKTKGPAFVDWDLEIKKGEAYFARLEENAKGSYQAQKNMIWDQAVSKEDAEQQITRLDAANSMARVARARIEHATMLAMMQARYEKEAKPIIGSNPVNSQDPTKRAEQQANQDRALDELRRKLTDEQIAQEKKLTGVISEEVGTRRGELQKLQEQRLDMTRQMQDEALATSKALADVGAAAYNEWGKLQVKIGEASDTLLRAMSDLPKAPDKAIELAKQARDAFAALQQDLAGLRKNLRDTYASFREGETQIRQATMTPVQKRQDTIQEIQRSMEEARQLRDAGLLQESQSVLQSAGQKAASLATPTEGQSPFAAQAEASALFQQIKAEGVAVAQQRLQEAEATNERLKEKIIEAGDVIAQAFESKLAITNQQIGLLTGAIVKLTETLQATKTFAPSGESQKQASVKAGEGTPGAKTAPSGAQGELTTGGQQVGDLSQRIDGKPLSPGRRPSVPAGLGNVPSVVAETRPGPREPATLPASVVLSEEYGDDWRRANSPNSAKMLKYDYETEQRRLRDPNGEKERLMKTAYLGAGKEGDYSAIKDSERRSAELGKEGNLLENEPKSHSVTSLSDYEKKYGDLPMIDINAAKETDQNAYRRNLNMMLPHEEGRSADYSVLYASLEAKLQPKEGSDTKSGDIDSEKQNRTGDFDQSVEDLRQIVADLSEALKEGTKVDISVHGENTSIGWSKG
jgi:hypothetical protein